MKEYCKIGHADFEYKFWIGERMNQCRTKVIEIGMANKQTATYIGTIYVEEMRNIKLAWNNTAWDENLGIRVQNVIAFPGVPGAELILDSVQLKWEFNCTYAFLVSCYNDGGAPSIGPQTVAALRAVQFTTIARKGIVAPPAGAANGLSNMRFTATHPQFTIASGLTGVSPLISCDASVGMRNTQGCSFAAVVPVLDYTDFTGLNEFMYHVKQAQLSGLPGANGGQPLNRVTSKQTIRDNRRGSCGGVTGPRPSGRSCDEYPFASTNQGARPGGPYAGLGRTFPNCGIKDNDLQVGGTGGTGYSVCMIDRGQNSSAGSILGWFYAKNRVLSGESFRVYVG
ncbi:hypothetical protein ERC79_13185 [Rhodococcus sp. ABRD24]|uniref:NucA/NucB deoxyribonuclease domain-containing protein n=1 Tax=Rhodococcus sp. ABRD24 TaxID=2507582 RepID=UPI00103B963B|nr:hypothetical protein [Rhodococcus sp. ABRD24]QBJ96802.1 hypothetical protein ERC79_13185 [Rhodococcus sp. ABRD24]